MPVWGKNQLKQGGMSGEADGEVSRDFANPNIVNDLAERKSQLEEDVSYHKESLKAKIAKLLEKVEIKKVEVRVELSGPLDNLKKIIEQIEVVEVEIKNIGEDVAALDAAERKIDSLRQEIKQHFVAFARLVAALVVKEKAVATETEPGEKGQVDLSAELAREILDRNPAGFQAALEEAIAAAYLPDRDSEAVKNNLKKFLKDIDVDTGVPPLRQKLAEEGIANWEAFARRFENELAEKFAGVLGEVAQSRMRLLAGQEIGAIRELADEGWTPSKFIKDAAFDFSFIWKMKGSVAVRLAINAVLLTGTAAVMNYFIRMDGAAKATIMGTGVGFMRGLVSMFTGENKTFQEPIARAKREAEAEKMGLIAKALIKRMFNPDGTLNAAAGNELGHLFSATLRRVTEPEKKEEYEIAFNKGAPDEFILKGDAVCIYHEGLKRAAEQGLGVAETTKLEFARAIHALHNNKGKTIADTPPALQTGFLGKLKTVGSATVLGAAAGWLIHATTAGRAVVGAGYGLIRENKSSAAEDRKAGDRGSRKNLDVIEAHIALLLKKADAATEEDRARLREYQALLAALASGQKLGMLLPALELLKKEKPGVFAKIGRRLKGQKAEPQHAASDAIDWLRNNAHDVKLFIDRDQFAQTKIESLQRDIASAEVRFNFAEALESLKTTSQALRGKAENNPRIRRWRKAGRMLKYAAIGAGVSLVIGKSGEIIWKHLMGEPAAPAAHHETAAPVEQHTVAVAPATAEAHPVPSAPAPAPGFSPESAVHEGEGITHPIVRQLLDKFKGDIEHNHKPAITLEDGHEYQFRGNIRSEKALENFAVKMSAEMAKLRGDINLKAGTENWLKFMGEGKGHVVLTNHDGKLGYEIHNEVLSVPHRLGAGEHAPALKTDHQLTAEDQAGEPPHHEAPTVSLDTHILHLTGQSALADQLVNPLNGQAVPGIDIPNSKIDLVSHSTSGGGAAAGGEGGVSADQVIQELQEKIAQQTFTDWAVHKSEDIHDMLEVEMLTKEHLAEWTKEFVAQHPGSQLKDLHKQFETFIEDKADAAESSAGGNGILLEKPAAVVSPAALAHEEAAKIAPAARGGAAPRALAGAEAPVVGPDHPIVIETQGSNRVIHFLDRNDHKDHAATISETLSPQPSGNEHNPLLIKLRPLGRAIPARLEMHSIPGKLDMEPVVVVETAGDDDTIEEVLYRIVDGKFDEIEPPPAS
ncbi:MAG: hypothetical protein HY983_01330 [Candidatus Magasanikbacteria bacterium]|nr:hypothetical protein [Candidatus Magasanikbacteria bacterium]